MSLADPNLHGEAAGSDAGPPPEAKLSPDQGRLRAPRDRPARYNGRITALLCGGGALFVVGAIVAPMLFPKHPHARSGQAITTNTAASPPIQTASYDDQANDPNLAGSAGGGPNSAAPNLNGASASPSYDCSLYPAMPGCAATMPTVPAAAGQANGAPLASGDQAPVAANGGAGAPPQSRGPAMLGLPGSDPAAAAKTSGLFFGGPLASAGGALAAIPGAPGPTPVSAQPPIALPSPQAPLPSQSRAPAPAPAEVMAQNGQGEKVAFAGQPGAGDYVEAKLQHPRSPYEVKAGAVIPAALMTAINSDLPGEVIAQVTQPVYDHVTGHFVLIPQGSRIIGRYDSQVAYGQRRAMVVWRRIIFPNGNSLDFGAMGATDPSGQAGVADRVDDHFGQIAKGVVLSSLLSMGVASAQDANARSSGALVVNSGATGVANEAEEVGSRIVARDLNRQPTLQIRQGAQVRVLVDKDLILEPYR